MPRVDLICRSCGHAYEALRSFSTVDPDADRCPCCGGTDLETGVPCRVSGTRSIDPGALPADEVAMHLENKAWQEANSDKLLSGEWSHVVPKGCPEPFRPVLPESMRKRYF